MKTLLLGHDGQIGGELFRRLTKKGQVSGLSYPDIDYSNIDDVIHSAWKWHLENKKGYNA